MDVVILIPVQNLIFVKYLLTCHVSCLKTVKILSGRGWHPYLGPLGGAPILGAPNRGARGRRGCVSNAPHSGAVVGDVLGWTSHYTYKIICVNKFLEVAILKKGFHLRLKISENAGSNILYFLEQLIALQTSYFANSRD